MGQVRIYNPAGSVQVIADVGGWFTDEGSTQGGTRFTGIAPFRFFDSRDPGVGALGPGETGTLSVVDQNGQPATELSAIVINVTATDTTAPGYLTLWPDGAAGRPTASDLNWASGQTVPNLVVVKLGNLNAIDIFNAAGFTDVVVDLVGFYGSAITAPAAPARPFSLRFGASRRH